MKIHDRGKLRDCALMLGVSGFILTFPLFLNLAKASDDLWGWPFILVYIFVVWALLIGMALFLSGGLRDLAYPDASGANTSATDDGPPDPP